MPIWFRDNISHRYEKKIQIRAITNLVLLSQAWRWVNDDIVLFWKKKSQFFIGYKTMYNGKKKEIKNTGKAQCNPFVEYYKYMYVY